MAQCYGVLSGFSVLLLLIGPSLLDLLAPGYGLGHTFKENL